MFECCCRLEWRLLAATSGRSFRTNQLAVDALGEALGKAWRHVGIVLGPKEQRRARDLLETGLPLGTDADCRAIELEDSFSLVLAQAGACEHRQQLRVDSTHVRSLGSWPINSAIRKRLETQACISSRPWCTMGSAESIPTN